MSTATTSKPPDLLDRLRAARRGPGGPLAGVCEGRGRGGALDRLVVRISFIALATAGGAGIALYVILALVMPRAGAASPPVITGRAAGFNLKETAGVALLALSSVLTLRALGLWWSDTVAA